jgi:hypothetical protein
MRESQLEEVLSSKHQGQWYGFSDIYNKGYDTLIIHDDSITKPTESEFNQWCDEYLTSTAWKQLREKRNRLLTETDWAASTDITMSPEMTEYRKALRDLPSTADINNPVYPEKPEGG